MDLKKFLELPATGDFRLLNKIDNITDIPVENISLLEPPVEKFVRRHEIILSQALTVRDNETDLKQFIEEYKASVEYTSTNVDETAQLIADYGVVASATIAKKALPKCHIVCYTNNDMKDALKGFLKVLYDQNPKSVGGSMPEDDFYYEY